MSVPSDSEEWEDLRRELEKIAGRAKAFNAYVFDAWDTLWCAAHGFTLMPRDDLADIVHVGVGKGLPLHRGGTLDKVVSGPVGHAFLKSYASCYVLLLRYAGAFDANATRTIVFDALPRLEALTLRLPPSGGPGSDSGEAAKRA